MHLLSSRRSGTASALVSGRRRKSILFVYPYAAAKTDAVGAAVNQMADAVSNDEVNATVLSLPTFFAGPRISRSKIARVVEQIYFLTAAAVWIYTNRYTRSTVVTVDAPSGVGFLGRLAQKTGGAHVAWVMDLYRTRETRKGRGLYVRGRSWRLNLEVASLRKADAIVTIGECMKTVLSEIVHREVVVIPLWADPDLQITGGYEPDSRQNGGTRPLRLLYSGSARSIHPLEGIVQAADALDGAVTITLAGAGEEIERAVRIALQKGIKSVYRVDPVPKRELGEFYREFDAHVVSLAPDATGTCVPSKTYSSLASAVPVIYLGGADGQAALDLIGSNSGVVLDPYDLHEITSALSYYVDNRSVLVKMGKSGQEFVWSERNIGLAAGKFRDICIGAALAEITRKGLR